MVFQVTMSEQEAAQMLADKKNRGVLQASYNRLQELAHKVVSTLGLGNPGDGIIIFDQDEAEELLEMAAMYME